MASPSSTRSQGPAFIRALGYWDVVLMTLVAVVSPRWITRSAAAGAPALVLWLLAAILFGVPLAITAMALARRYPEQGGLYRWTHRAFGPLHGFLSGWCYWLSNLFFFPSILLFAAPNVLMFFGPSTAGLAESRAYTALFVLAALWVCTALNIRGVAAGRTLQQLGTIGLWIPVALLLAAASIALATIGSATSFVPEQFVPRSSTGGLLGLWSALCFAFIGFEITTFMGQEVRDPVRTIPRAVPISVAMVAVYYVVGAAAVLVVLPANAFSEQTGLAEAVDLVAARLSLPGVGRVVGLLVAIGYLAITNSWMAGAARIPFAAGAASAMPAALGRLHPRYRTPHVAIIVQALAASVVFLVSLFLTIAGARTTVTEAYDILVGLTIVANLIPYFYLFAALVRLTRHETREGASLVMRARRLGLWVVAGCGIVTTAVAIVLTFVPPPGTVNVANYEANLLLQTAGVLVVGFAVYGWSRGGRT